MQQYRLAEDRLKVRGILVWEELQAEVNKCTRETFKVTIHIYSLREKRRRFD